MSGVPDDEKAEKLKNLCFGDIVTDIVAIGNTCTVTSNGQYTLKINGSEFFVKCGINSFNI